MKLPKPKSVLSDENEERAIIIFIKNPQLGKVKTRLAATVGKEKALEIYLKLLEHTQNITTKIEAERFLYYSDFVDKTDAWSSEIYHKKVQNQNPDLGEKMAFAFKDMIDLGYKKALIIGSDCIELSKEILNQAYAQIVENEVVIGPATDGGYYLIGFDFEKIGSRCGEVLKTVFLNKNWSHDDVCKEAIESCTKLNLKFGLLPQLNDIDEEKDYQKFKERF